MTAVIKGIEGGLFGALQPMYFNYYMDAEYAKRFLDPTRYGLPANASQKELVAAKVNVIRSLELTQLVLKICRLVLIILGTIYLPSNSEILGGMRILFAFQS